MNNDLVSLMGRSTDSKADNQAIQKEIGSLGLFQDRAVLDMMVTILGSPIDPDQVIQSAGISKVDLKTLLFNPLIASPVNIRFEAVMAKLFKLSDASGQKDTISDMRLLKLSKPGTPVHNFLYEQLNPYLNMLSRGILNARLFGYGVFEIQYNELTKNQQLFTIKNLWEKPFDWFEPQQINRDLFVYNRETEEEVKVGESILKFLGDTGLEQEYVDTQKKFLLIQNEPTYANPYGEAMLSRMYWSYFNAKGLNMLWLKFLEVSAHQRLYYKTELGDDLAPDVLSNLIQGGVASGSGELKAFTNAGDGVAFEKFQRFISVTISQYFTGRAALVDLSSGSRAAQSDETENSFLNIVQSDVDFCIEYINKITQMILNANQHIITDTNYEWYYDTEIGLHTERAERDKILTEANPKLKFTQKYYEQNFDLKKDEFVLSEDIPNNEENNTVLSQTNTPLISAKFAEEKSNNETFPIIKGVKLQPLADRNFNQEALEFETDSLSISQQIFKFLNEERELILNSIFNKNGIDKIIAESKVRQTKLFDNIYQQQAEKYGIDTLQPSTEEAIEQVKDAIALFLKKQDVAKFDSDLIEENTQSTVIDLVDRADKEDLDVEQLKSELANLPTFSTNRAKVIAYTINGTSRNMGQFIAAKMAGATTKKWISLRDDRVRNIHEKRNNSAAIGIDEVWMFDGVPIRMPCDHLAAPADRIQCRCWAVYE